MFILTRSNRNPVLQPNKEQSWEAEAVFNGCPVKRGKKVYLVYRALSRPHYHSTSKTRMQISDIGIAESTDGAHFSNRRKFIVPEEMWERFGCEDPRVTKLGDTYYTFYTALSAFPFRAEGIKVAIALSHDLKTVTEKHLVTPFNAKAMSLFPEKINGKFYALLTVDTDRPPSKIALASFDKEEDMWSEKKWNAWYKKIDSHTLPFARRKEDHVELGAPPIKTKEGWLIIYSYIQNYFSPERLFTIEALLLDLYDPSKIIARINYPLLTPEEGYERYGNIPNVVFPSGALLEKNTLSIYYGAADTSVALATVPLSSIMTALFCTKECVGEFTRAKENPIISPIKENAWEARLTFNPAALYEDGEVHILYRAMSNDNTSTMGYARSADGVHIDYRSPKPAYVPREPFEQKLNPGGYSGCEDPRLTRIGNTVYMLYTAYDGVHPPRIAFTSIPLKKFLAQKWEWETPVLISPPEFDNKDACVAPEKVKGKYLFFHRFGSDIDIALVPNLSFNGEEWLEEHRWLFPRPGMWDSLKVGIAAPPLKTKDGWILLYHGVSAEDRHYRLGALLLDRHDPTKILSRTNEPLLEPKTEYEKVGEIPNVVFPCGAVIIKDTLFTYYGGGDSVVGVATVPVVKLLAELKKFDNVEDAHLRRKSKKSV